MDIWNILALLWIPCLLVGLCFQIRALYLKQILVKKYGFHFPESFFRPVKIGELRTNYTMTDLPDLKKVIAKFIVSKKWFYIFLFTAILILTGPFLFKWWLSTGTPGSRK